MAEQKEDWSDKDEQAYQECLKKIGSLKQSILEIEQKTETKFTENIKNHKTPKINIQCKKTCEGHFGKVYDVSFTHDGKYFLSASQDGKIIIWNSITGNKQLFINLENEWVITADFSNDINYIASGGLDNMITIHNPGNTFDKDVDKPSSILNNNNDGYISCIKYISNESLINSSADGSISKWDLNKKKVSFSYNFHNSDVLRFDIPNNNKSLIITASNDKTCKLIDLRDDTKEVFTFRDMLINNDNNNNNNTTNNAYNDVKWFNNSNSFIAGNDLSDIKLFDIRSYKKINNYKLDNNTPVTALNVSKSGGYIFGAYDDGELAIIDTLKGKKLQTFKNKARIHSLDVEPNGYGLLAACWNSNVNLYY